MKYRSDIINNIQNNKKETNLIDTKNILKIGVIASLFFISLTIAANIGGKSDVLLKERSLKELKKNLTEEKKYEKGLGGFFTPDIVPAPVTYFDYEIKKGEAIHNIANRTGIDALTLIKLNDISIPSMVRYGTKIVVPNKDGLKVDVNKDLEKIASKYGYDKDELLRVNSLSTEDGVDSIFVPGIHFDSVARSLILGEYFRRPAYGRFTSYYGYRRDPITGRRIFHQGVDIANRRGGQIMAAAPGKVIFVGKSWIYGNLVKVKHTSGYVTYYGHLRKAIVKPGMWVKSGQTLGYMGNSGRSTGVHLHFEVRKWGRTINPFKVTVF